MTTREEMIRLIEKVGETQAATGWFRRRNEELQACLADISISAVRFDRVGGRSGTGDGTAAAALRRADMEEEMRLNENAIRERLSLHASISLLMTEVLDADERAVLWARYAEHLPWDRVARAARLSRTACFRKEKEGLEKLCKMYDMQQGKG